MVVTRNGDGSRLVTLTAGEVTQLDAAETRQPGKLQRVIEGLFDAIRAAKGEERQRRYETASPATRTTVDGLRAQIDVELGL